MSVLKLLFTSSMHWRRNTLEFGGGGAIDGIDHKQCLPQKNSPQSQSLPAPLSVGAQAQLGRISPKWENKIWVQTGDSLPNGRTLFHKALCRLYRGTFAGDKSMFNGFLGSNYPNSPSSSKFHRLLFE